MKTIQKTQNEIDPTANVLKLVEEATKRLDDLRNAEGRRIDNIMRLTNEHEEIVRDLTRQLREAESKRLDAIREVDNVNTSRNTENANAQALALAKNVTDTAAMMAKQLENITSQQSQRISVLETTLSEIKGKSTVEDDLPKRLALLERASSSGEGKSKGLKDMWGYFIAIFMAGIAIAGLVIKLTGG